MGGGLRAILRPTGYAGAVRAGQQPRRADAAEASGHDGPQSQGHPGEGSGVSAFRSGADLREVLKLVVRMAARARGRPSPVWPEVPLITESAETVVPGVVSKLPSAS